MIPGATEILVIFFFVGFSIICAVLFTVVPFWRICTKAGFPGALSLLMLVPVANIVLPFYLAFADWPALRRPDGGPAVTL